MSIKRKRFLNGAPVLMVKRFTAPVQCQIWLKSRSHRKSNTPYKKGGWYLLSAYRPPVDSVL